MSETVHTEEQLFSAALAMPDLEREGFVSRVCAHNIELERSVRELIAAVDEGAHFVKEAIRTYGSTETDEIPRHRLKQEIGEGGCGVVYLAEQVEPIRREVAIKVIKLGMDTKAVIARFRAEQQALALMDHPNIAHVFDAGATSAGRPYFVMELVRGIKITDYCRYTGLGIEDRIELLMQVCNAIQHAHLKAVVHRDIKPSNVLVTLKDGKAVVKVIDFGVAKAVQGQLTEETVDTSVEQFIGTPEYASPEQLLSGRVVDERSDIYSLGVLAYELLTDRTPLRAAVRSDGRIEQVRDWIRTDDPIAPSKLLRSIEHRRFGAAVRRGSRVNRDLDLIVMRCLMRDPIERFGSVRDLVADLVRFSRSQPILARPPSPFYSMRMFSRRNRRLVVATAIVVLTLFSATVISTWQALRAARAQSVALNEADAREKVIDFLRRDLLSQAAPFNEPDRDIKLRTVLDRASAKVDDNFKQRPLVRASLHETLGETYESLGEYRIAEHHLRAAEAIYRSELGEDDARTLAAGSGVAREKAQLKDYANAELLARNTLSIQLRVRGAHHDDTLDTMDTLAQAIFGQGRYAEAAIQQAKLVETFRSKFGLDHFSTLNASTQLARTYALDGKFEDARVLLKSTLARSRLALGQEHMVTLTTMLALASVENQLRNVAEAERLQVTLLETTRRVLGDVHPMTLAIMNNLGITYENQGRFSDAETLKKQVVDLQQQVNGREHPDTLKAMNNLAYTYVSLGKLAEAEAIQQEALSATTRVMGRDHPDRVFLLGNLARTLVLRGHAATAEPLATDAYEIGNRTVGKNHPDSLKSGATLGITLLAQSKWKDAEKLFRSIAHEYEGRFPSDWRLLSVRSGLGEALTGQRRFAEAEPLLLDAYEGLRHRASVIPASRRTEISDAADRIVALYQQWGKAADAARWRTKLADPIRCTDVRKGCETG